MSKVKGLLKSDSIGKGLHVVMTFEDGKYNVGIKVGSKHTKMTPFKNKWEAEETYSKIQFRAWMGKA